MKKLFAVLVSAFALVFASSCKEEPTFNPSLSLDPAVPIQFDNQGGTKTITVTTNLDTWTVASNQTWCKVTPLDGAKSFSVVAEQNSEKDPRPAATLTVTAKCASHTLTATITVTQAGIGADPFAITLSDIDNQSVMVGVVPTDKKVRYFCGAVSNDVLQNEYAGDLAALISTSMERIIKETYKGDVEVALAEKCHTGDQSILLNQLDQNADHTVFVVGLDNQAKISTRIVKQEFKTLDATFTFAATDITPRSAKITVTPSLVNADYIWAMMTQDDYDYYKDDMATYVEEFLLFEDYETLLTKGPDELLMKRKFTPSTKYYIWSAYMDADQKIIGDLKVEGVFTTLADQPNPAATMNIVIDKYFNGDDLYDLDNVKYKAAKGKAIVPAKFTPQSDVIVGWYSGLLFTHKDFSIFDMMEEEEVLDSFLYKGYGKWSTLTNEDYYCFWGVISACAAGLDANDNLCAFYHQDYTFTKEGASPISEYKPVEVTKSAAQVLPPRAAKPKFISYRTAL